MATHLLADSLVEGIEVEAEGGGVLAAVKDCGWQRSGGRSAFVSSSSSSGSGEPHPEALHRS